MSLPTAVDTETVYARLDSPLGPLLACARGGAITGLWFGDGPHAPMPDAGWRRAPQDPVLRQLARELVEYFAGRRRAFDVAVAPEGTPFQQAVWRALRTVPYGATASYAAIAAAIDRPRAVRATGAANGRNPVSIVIPCHRIVGADGSLTGYAGGLARKEWLLLLESGIVAPPLPTPPPRQGARD
jgi:methylated-DNA-[protein]-cysteine S-methyltransferase